MFGLLIVLFLLCIREYVTHNNPQILISLVVSRFPREYPICLTPLPLQTP